MLIKKKYDKDNKIIFLEPIKEYLDEIKGSYQNLYQNFLKTCIFPTKIYDEIIETLNNINNRLKNENQKNIKKEFEYLSTQLNNFSEKIKKASYGNDILKKIKKANNNLVDVIQTIDIDILNNSKIEELNSSINLYENEEEENFKNYSNFSFVKKLSLIYENDDSKKNEISLVCPNCSAIIFVLIIFVKAVKMN